MAAALGILVTAAVLGAVAARKTGLVRYALALPGDRGRLGSLGFAQCRMVWRARRASPDNCACSSAM